MKLFVQAALLMFFTWLISFLLVRLFAAKSQAQMLPMTLAAFIALLGAVAGLCPLLIAALKSSELLGKAFLLGVPLRLLTTMTLGLLCCILVERQQRSALLLWLSSYYIVMLGWETALAIKFVNRYMHIDSINAERRNIQDDSDK
ncbi:MAG: hypothetical protein JEZ07_11050 [Phycisphaerae bacterium]|nr:hypothetical protein [Phycisphaerae bacterium]